MVAPFRLKMFTINESLPFHVTPQYQSSKQRKLGILKGYSAAMILSFHNSFQSLIFGKVKET